MGAFELGSDFFGCASANLGSFFMRKLLLFAINQLLIFRFKPLPTQC